MKTIVKKAQKTTVTIKRANGSVETIDITAKIGNCSKIGFEARILPALIAANKKAGSEVLSWTHEDAVIEIECTEADKKAMAEEQDYIESRKKTLEALNA